MMNDDENTVAWLPEHQANRHPDRPDIRATRASAEYIDLQRVAALGETAMKAIQNLQQIAELQTGSPAEVANAVLETIRKMTSS